MSLQTILWDDEGATPADVDLAKRIGHHLERHYPGHPWAIHVSHRNGTVLIRHSGLTSLQNDADGGVDPLSLLRQQYQQLAYYIPIGDLSTDPMWHSVTFAGGTLLEYWHQARAKFRPETVAEALPSSDLKTLKAGKILTDG